MLNLSDTLMDYCGFLSETFGMSFMQWMDATGGCIVGGFYSVSGLAFRLVFSFSPIFKASLYDYRGDLIFDRALSKDLFSDSYLLGILKEAYNR